MVCSGGEQIPRWDCSAPGASRVWPGAAVYLVGRKRSSRLNERRDSVQVVDVGPSAKGGRPPGSGMSHFPQVGSGHSRRSRGAEAPAPADGIV